MKTESIETQEKKLETLEEAAMEVLNESNRQSREEMKKLASGDSSTTTIRGQNLRDGRESARSFAKWRTSDRVDPVTLAKYGKSGEDPYRQTFKSLRDMINDLVTKRGLNVANQKIYNDKLNQFESEYKDISERIDDFYHELFSSLYNSDVDLGLPNRYIGPTVKYAN